MSKTYASLFLLLAIQYDKEKGFSSGWIEPFKKTVVETTVEIDNLFDKINTKKIDTTRIKNFGKFFSDNKITSSKEDLEAFFKVWDNTGDVAEAYKKYMIDSGKATTSFSIGVKGAGKAIKGFIASLGSMAAMWAIGELVGLFVENVINAQEKAIETMEETVQELNNQRDALKANKKTIDSIKDEYATLSKGVDSLGRNVSLNTEEYARYNEIVNQIADMFPQLIQGYTDEGVAILKHKGDVEELTQAYKDQKKAYQDSIITGSAKVFKGYKAKVDHDAFWGWEEHRLLTYLSTIKFA